MRRVLKALLGFILLMLFIAGYAIFWPEVRSELRNEEHMRPFAYTGVVLIWGVFISWWFRVFMKNSWIYLDSRRILFSIGLTMLVGGWGLTHYADEQQQATSTKSKLGIWSRGDDSIPITSSKDLYLTGVIGMGAGAGLIGLAAWPTKAKESKKSKEQE